MPKLIDLTGQRFGSLVVLEHVGRGKWKCRCDCGNECVKHSTLLRNGVSNNCGCMTGKKISANDTKHGGCGTKLYQVWKSMRQRCTNPNNKDYPDYGGKGITVCDEWQDFGVFRDWALMNGYREGLSIDRIDTTEGYSPSNCRWTNVGTQAWNRRHTSRQDMWKPIGAFDNDGNLVQMFKNVVGAVEWLGKESTTAPGISAVLHGQQNTAYGYRWCYLTERKIEVPHNVSIRYRDQSNDKMAAFDCVSFEYDADLANGYFSCDETGKVPISLIENLSIDGLMLIGEEKSA